MLKCVWPTEAIGAELRRLAVDYRAESVVCRFSSLGDLAT